MNWKIKLKPCPFCGSEDLSVGATYFLWYENQKITEDDGIDQCTISCGDCGIDMVRETKKDAIKSWNTRHQT